jgi:hypothetical protein
MIDQLGLALYAACVDFMIRLANACSMTYRDANALLFFVLWPLVTVSLLIVRVRQEVELRALRRALEGRSRRADGALVGGKDVGG